MRSLKSLLGLPNPVDAGWSDCDALGSEIFGLAPGQKSWEQFDAHLKATYPVRAFFAITLTDWFFSTVWYPSTRPIKDAHYWLVSHIVPARRYHMLDLRKAKSDYKYGWVDSDHQIECAMFAILNNFVEKEMRNKYLPTEEDIAAESTEYGQQDRLRDQRARCLEVLAIHSWWNEERPRLEQLNSKPLKWEEKMVVETLEEKMVAETLLESKLEEMMIRLVKIRHTMWT